MKSNIVIFVKKFNKNEIILKDLNFLKNKKKIFVCFENFLNNTNINSSKKYKKYILYKIGNLNYLKNILGDIDYLDILSFFCIPKNFKELQIIYFLKKERINYSIFFLSAQLSGYYKRKKNLNYFLNFFRILKVFENKFLQFLFDKLLINYNCLITSSQKKIKLSKKTFKQKIYTHSHNYQKSLKLNKNKILKNYIVFVDQAIPGHPDYKDSIDNDPFDRKYYYKSINKVLEELGNKYNKKIIIAGHPKNYQNKSKINFNFPVYFFRTSNLIKNSYLVVNHISTSIDFAVIFKKPII